MNSVWLDMVFRPYSTVLVILLAGAFCVPGAPEMRTPSLPE